MHAMFGYLSLIVAFISWGIYTYWVLRGYTKPHIFSWTIYAVISALVFWIQYSSGSGAGSWATAATGLGCFITMLLCFKYGTTDITRSDKIAFLFGIPAIAAWYFTSTPFLTLCLIITAETLGFYGTIRKSYKRPYEEAVLPYALSTLKLVFVVFAAETHNFYTLAYPIYYVFLYPGFIAMVLWRRTLVQPAKTAEPTPSFTV